MIEIGHKRLETPETRGGWIRPGTKHRKQQMGRMKGDGNPWSLGHTHAKYRKEIHWEPVRGGSRAVLLVCLLRHHLCVLCERWLVESRRDSRSRWFKAALDR